MADPKLEKKGDPKLEKKGDPKLEKRGDPKLEKRGAPPGESQPSGCGNNDAAVNILRTAADLCGFLVVAVVSPMGGGRGSAGCSTPSAQKLALSEARRKAELRNREAAAAKPPS